MLSQFLEKRVYIKLHMNGKIREMTNQKERLFIARKSITRREERIRRKKYRIKNLIY